MIVHCAQCTSFVCRGGKRDAGPDFCPMHGDFPDFRELYRDPAILRMAVQAALIEGEGYGRWTRLREVGELCRALDLRRVGIAHDPDMEPEAGRIVAFLQGRGVEPLLPPSSPRCEPEEQAAFFAGQGAQLNLLGGLSVGDEIIFIRASPAPVVALVARDRRLRHNPAAALYTSRSYLQGQLFGHWDPRERPPFQGWGKEALARAAEEALERDGEHRPRVAEAMEVAHRLGATHLGISFCVGFREEARILAGILETNGFRVSSACCKTGAVPKEEVGIEDARKVRPGRPEMICNPLAQAELLNREGVHFALVLGQCVGHDAATFHRLQAPVACVVAKDRVLAHNTVAALG